MEEIWLVVLQYPFIHTCLKFLFSLRKEDHKDLLNIEWKIWAFAIKDKKEEALTPEIQTKNNNYSLQKKNRNSFEVLHALSSLSQDQIIFHYHICNELVAAVNW